MKSVYSAVRSGCLYRMIKTSLCILLVYCNHHVHKDFWPPCTKQITFICKEVSAPDSGMNCTGPREALLEFVVSVFQAIFMNKYFILEIFWGEKYSLKVSKNRPSCWPEETTKCYKISLSQWLINNLNVILYLSTCHYVNICVLILFMIMP
jgi:hypothetical protein